MKQNDVLFNFGMQLKKLRAERGCSQETMAAHIGLDRAYYAAVEVGKRNVSLKNINKIAIGFNLSLSDLFKEVR